MPEPWKVGIVIPTLNRSQFVLRQLRYYAQIAPGCPVYLGDSSRSEHFERVAAALAEPGHNFTARQIPAPGLNDIQAMSEALRFVEEPYAAFIGDDDFFVPAALAECASFLDAHPDYATAHGVAASCVIDGAPKAVSPYGQGEILGDSAAARLLHHFSHYYVSLFSVHRTDSFRRELAATQDLSDKGLREILLSTLATLHGKSRQIDSLALIRVHHDSRYLGPDVFDWITNPDWRPSYVLMADCLARELAAFDGVSVEAARGLVKNAFWNYLAGVLPRKRTGTYERRPFRTRFGAAMEQSAPAMLAGARRLISYLPSQSERLSLPALMRPSSPYHAQFLAFHQFVTSAAGQL